MNREVKTKAIAAQLTLTPGLTTFFAIATGVSVANLYYSQPLLHLVARGLGVPAPAAGWAVTLSQLGYAVGLFVFVPLGDGTDRRKTIVGLLLAVATFLLVMATAPVLWVFDVGAFLVGVTTVVPQIVVPLAADLATPERRGRAVGTVMSGLLLGILASRVFGGWMGQWLGWRAVFALAAGFALVLAAGFWRWLPPLAPHQRMAYRQLLASLRELVATLPALREASVSGAALFGIFSALWTTLTFHLSGPPFHFSAGVIGLFGLAGLAGAAMAPLAGHLADRRPPAQQVWMAYGILAAGVALLWAGVDRLGPLVAGIVLVDAGCQFGHVSNQSRVYAQHAQARSRLNTVYMVSYFLGGSVGSSLGLLAFQRGGWPGVIAVQGGLIALGLAVPRWVGVRARQRVSR
ncbi:MAG: MFS transporter [Firmicutes bacterium]|nr:MFS transporter [Alicyclobacillaceae bacterium]MCL6496508.1 MFS transporter [Bacillota bacterium]